MAKMEDAEILDITYATGHRMHATGRYLANSAYSANTALNLELAPSVWHGGYALDATQMSTYVFVIAGERFGSAH